MTIISHYNVSRSKVQEKHSILEQTALGEIELDYKNPKLYKKVLRFYEDQGIEFYDDPYDTYELIVDLLKEDLQKWK